MTDEEFAEYWPHLVHKKQAGMEELSFDERIFYAANHFRGSILRSGLLGYFENTQCSLIHDAQLALQTMGCPDVEELLTNAVAIVLNGRPLPSDDECLELFGGDLSEEEFDAAMDALDERLAEIQTQLYECTDALYEVLLRFAEQKKLGRQNG